MRFNLVSRKQLIRLGNLLSGSIFRNRHKVAISVAGLGGGSLLILPHTESSSSSSTNTSSTSLLESMRWTHLLRLSYPAGLISRTRDEAYRKELRSAQLSLMEFIDRFGDSSIDELVTEMKAHISWTRNDLNEAIQLIHRKPDSEIGLVAFKVLTAVVKSSLTNAHRVVSCGMDKTMIKLIGSSNASRTCSQSLVDLIKGLMDKCPKLDDLKIDQWMVPLMEKLESKDIDEILFGITLLDSIIQTSNPKVIQILETSKIWSLLEMISDSKNTQIKCKIASLLASLSQGGLRPSDEDWELWFDKLLKWSANPELLSSCVNSISTILCIDDEKTLCYGRKWLSNGVGTSPSEMRYLASEILGLRPHEPPMDYHETHYNPSQETFRLDWEDQQESSSIALGIRVFCDLATSSQHEGITKWLVDRGILTLCQTLMKRDDELIESLPSIEEQQQVTRLLAIISKKFDQVSSLLTSWIPWLEINLKSEDLLLASHSLRALLHIKQIQQTSECQNLAFHDGLHFFQSSPELLESLLLNKSDQFRLDVVFVHGIRGGPFITWRIDNDNDHHNTRSSCWPSFWLSQDHPETRLVTVEFPAPVSTWEGGCNPLKETAWTLLNKLTEAGIGSRPLMFISHSMGGIVVKEMLQQALCKPLFQELISNLSGLAFISTPHHGTWLAELGWSLRHIGACPSPSLNLMKPGTYLEELNDQIKSIVLKFNIPVLSFSEGKTSKFSSILPSMFVVPHSSAYPGYGQIIHLPLMDHIKTCKPKDKLDVFYSNIDKFIRQILTHL
eukprot:g6187.t1